METAFVHECARHDAVVDEVAGHEPGFRINVKFGTDQAEAEPTAGGVEFSDSVHQPHSARWKRNGLTEGEVGEGRAKGGGEVALTEGVECFHADGLVDHGDEFEPVGWTLARELLEFVGGADDPLTGGEMLWRKEPCTAITHGQNRAAIDGGVEGESEEIGGILAEEAENFDVVDNHIAGLGEVVVEGHDGVEQAIHRQTLGDEVDAKVACEHQVSLTGFDGDTDRNAVAVKVPVVGEDIVFGHDSPVGHGERFAFEQGHAVHEHQGFIRQADTGGIVVNLGELLAEDGRDRATTVGQAKLAGEASGNFVRHERRHDEFRLGLSGGIMRDGSLKTGEVGFKSRTRGNGTPVFHHFRPEVLELQVGHCGGFLSLHEGHGQGFLRSGWGKWFGRFEAFVVGHRFRFF